MTDQSTPRLGLPYLQAGQAQKETTHNEALATLDLLVQPRVSSGPIDTPPVAPMPGDSWIVGRHPTGAWAGQADAIAGWSEADWRFVVAREGLTAWVSDAGVAAQYVAGGWSIGSLRGTGVTIAGLPVVGQRRAAIADPAGGGTVDAEARAAIGAVLAALRGHGLIGV